MATIQVSRDFARVFHLYMCAIEADAQTERELREMVRADYENGSKWIRKQLALHSFAHRIWGRLPSVAECREFLIKRLGPVEDEGYFKRAGLMLQVEACAGAYGWPGLGGPGVG